MNNKTKVERCYEGVGMFSVLISKLVVKKETLFSHYNWDVLRELVRANFKQMENNFVLGSLWGLVGPVGMLGTLYFIFRSRFGIHIETYPLYLLIGIVLTNFFVSVTVSLLRVFFSNRELALNSAVSREVLILARLSISAYSFLIELIFCYVVSAFYGYFYWQALCLILPLFLAYIGLLLGIGFFLGVLFCFAKDIEHLWALISRLFFFATPIFYSLNDLSPFGKTLVYYLNPVTPFLISFRGVLMRDVSFFPYFHSLLIGLIFFAVGYSLFLLTENVMVEKI